MENVKVYGWQESRSGDESKHIRSRLEKCEDTPKPVD